MLSQSWCCWSRRGFGCGGWLGRRVARTGPGCRVKRLGQRGACEHCFSAFGNEDREAGGFQKQAPYTFQQTNSWDSPPRLPLLWLAVCWEGWWGEGKAPCWRGCCPGCARGGGERDPASTGVAHHASGCRETGKRGRVEGGRILGKADKAARTRLG